MSLKALSHDAPLLQIDPNRESEPAPGRFIRHLFFSADFAADAAEELEKAETVSDEKM